MRLGGVEIETVVQVDPHPESRLVDREVPPEPGAEEPDHRRIGVRELDFAVGLGTFACVERNAGGEERVVAERADALEAFGVQRGDLGELRLVGGVRTVLRTGSCASTA